MQSLHWDLQNWSLMYLARRIHGHHRESSGLVAARQPGRPDGVRAPVMTAARRYSAVILPVVAALGLAIGIAACAGVSAPPPGPSRPGELVVGTTPNYPPIIFKQGDEILVLPKVKTKSIEVARGITQIIYQIAIAAKVILDL